MISVLDRCMRFGGVGVVATLTHVAVATLCFQLLGMVAQRANLIAFSVAWLVSYLGNFHWTFGQTCSHRQSMPRFLAISLVGLAVNQSTVWLCTEVLLVSYLLALVPVVIVTPMVVFALSSIWAFKPELQSRHPAN